MTISHRSQTVDQNLRSSTLDRAIDYGYRHLLNLMSLGGKRLTVMIFHRVLDKPDGLREDEPDIESFSRQLKWIKQTYHIIPLSEGIRRIQNDSLKPRSLCITFDDGYEDNLINAVPILQEFGMPATFFVTTANINGGMMWNDLLTEAVKAWPNITMDMQPYGLENFKVDSLEAKRKTIIKLIEHYKYLSPKRRDSETEAIYNLSGSVQTNDMMDATQIRELANAGMEIGGHTHSHAILSRLELKDAEQEIHQNYSLLKKIMGQPPNLFAYPNGKPGRDYGPEHVQMIKDAGYKAAVTTSWGTMSKTGDIYQIPRFTPWDKEKYRYILHMAHNYLRRPDMTTQTRSTVKNDLEAKDTPPPSC